MSSDLTQMQLVNVCATSMHSCDGKLYIKVALKLDSLIAGRFFTAIMVAVAFDLLTCVIG